MMRPPIVTTTLEIACREYGVMVPRARQGRCIAQQVAAYILRRIRGWSYQRIGSAVGGASHSIVRAWCLRLDVERRINPEFARMVERLEAEISAASQRRAA